VPDRQAIEHEAEHPEDGAGERVLEPAHEWRPGRPGGFGGTGPIGREILGRIGPVRSAGGR
jgi:hypothetical protein